MITILQIADSVPLDKLAESTKTLSKTSIELAQAVSDYGALRVVFGIFIVMVILMMIIMVLSHMYMLKKVNLISDASIKVLKYFDNLSNRTVGIEEGNSIVREALNRCNALTKYYILRIRLENHIDNEAVTRQKVDKIAENSFAELNSYLSRFICVNKSLSTLINYDECESLKNLMIEQIYIPKENFTVSGMDQSVELFFSGMKLEYFKQLEILK